MNPISFNSKTIKKKMKNPFVLFIVLFIVLWLLIPAFTIRPIPNGQDSFMDEWLADIDAVSLSHLLTIDQPIMDGIVSADEQLSLSSVLLPMVTSLPYQDIRLLFGHELPNFSINNSTIAIRGSGTNHFTTSIESAPPDELFEDDEIVEDSKPDQTYTGESVFIYTSHNRESFLPELSEGRVPDEAFHQTDNVMKLSKKMSEHLKSQQIESFVDETDIWNELKKEGMVYHQSYDYSRRVVKQAQADNEDLSFMIDIHRDSQPREITTTEINGQPAAKIMFVIGGEHENYEKNLAFAADLHERIEEKYPTLSRGVEVKSGSGVNGVYNQDLAEHSIALEVGGYENTFEELYLTIKYFSEIFADYYFSKTTEEV
ncbi:MULTISPECIES: stage II sporulation protein P [Allobacillus]|uniref:Stage II sporulation protein P n=1 Tax=Allobacillus salarius TaxID=1955272 RepID=A0A556PTQ4_9BACI|nr:stage II sporulation protein P [Allobacillus salarius]TSJ67761.1 stage II sporulation protein P [Allobacillus salarius]